MNSKRNAKPPSLPSLRARAEAALLGARLESRRFAAGILPADGKYLLHELEVHQAELEVQNEELLSAQAELELSRDRLRDLYDYSPVGYLTLDARGKIVEANLTAARMLDVPRQDLIGQPFLVHAAPESARAFLLHRRKVFRTVKPDECELRLRKADGSIFPAALQSTPFTDPVSHARQCHTVLADITERQQAEVVRANEAQFRALFQLNPCPMWICDKDTLEFLEVNEAALKLYGYSRETFLQMTARDIRPPEDVPSFLRAVAGQRNSRATFAGEWPHVKRGGTVFEVAVTISNIQYAGRDARLAVISDITEQKRAEEALARSRAEMVAMFDAMTDVVICADAGRRFVLVNPAFTKVFGYSAEEVRGRTTEFLYTSADAYREAGCRRYHSGGWSETGVYEIQYRRKDGSVFWAESSGSRVQDAQGQVLGFVSIHRDITERKRTEEALRERDAEVKLALRAAVAGNWSWNAEAHRHVWSPEWYELYGLDPKVKPGFRNWLACVRREDRQAVDAIVKETLKKRVAEFSFEFRIQHPTRGERWIANKGRVTYNATNGEPLLAAGISLDITERKQAEQALRDLNATLERRVAERTRELSAANERLHAVMDTALIGIIGLDERGIIRSLNPATTLIFGYGPNELVGRNVSQFMAWPAQRRQESFLGHYLEGMTHSVLSGRREALGRTKEGGAMVLEVSVAEFRNSGGQQFVVMLRDITERKRLERELLEVGERERQRLGNDVHDGLGQHLHALFYMATLLEQELKAACPERAQEAGRLARQLERGLELTRSLARGLQPVKPMPEGLMVALRELAERTQALYRVECRFQCPAPVSVHRHAAANHLYRIAQEAVNNAMKHGKPTRVLIGLRATPKRVILGVRDNGRGFRRQRRRSQGMGLHIMQYRADAIRGSLAVQRLPTGGTAVICTVKRRALVPEEKDLE